MSSEYPKGIPHPDNPEGIESFSPALPMQSATLGNESEILSTLRGLNGFAWMRRVRVMQTRWGWELFWRTPQGSPALRANSGLNDGIPLGFVSKHLVAEKVS